MVEIMEPETEQKDFDAELYVKILITVAKADRENGPREVDFVKNQARRVGINAEEIWEEIGKTFSLGRVKVSRSTALAVVRDCIILASLDGNFTLAEKERTYTYAAKMDIPRKEVDEAEKWVMDYFDLKKRWQKLTGSHLA